MNDTNRLEDYHISGSIKAHLESMREVRETENPALTGLPTGFTALDRIISGLNNSDLIVLASSAGQGKTSFALNIARNVAVESNVPVLIFSLDVTEERLSMRMLSAESKMSGGISTAGDILAKAPIYIIDGSPGISIFDVEMMAGDVKEKTGAALVIIDYLQLIKGEAGAPDRRLELAEMAGNLKRLAEKLDVPVMLLSQLDFNLEERKRPNAGPGSIIQNADLVLCIYRDEISDPYTKQHNQVRSKIIIAKNRRGAPGIVALNFSRRDGVFKAV